MKPTKADQITELLAPTRTVKKVAELFPEKSAEDSAAYVNRLLREPWRKDARESPEEPVEIHVDLPRNVASEALLLEKIHSWVEQLRDELFQTVDAPFTDWKAVGRWLAPVAEDLEAHPPYGPFGEGDLLTDEELQRSSDIRRAIDAACEKLAELHVTKPRLVFPPVPFLWLPSDAQLGVDLTPGMSRLFTGKDEFGVPVPEDSLYGMLAAEVGQMSELMGFRRGQLTAHVLLGTQPVLEPARVERRTGFTRRGGARFHTYVTVRLNRPLSERQLRKLHGKIRDAWPDKEKEKPYRQLVRNVVHEVLGDRAGRDWSDASWRLVAQEFQERVEPHEKIHVLVNRLRVQYGRMIGRYR